MVNFGKRLMADQLEEWKEYYINYKMMKKKVKQYVQQTQNGGKNREQVLKEFSRVLDDQIEKIVLFLLQQQGHLASRIETLGEQRAALMEQSDFSQISQLRDAYREVGYDLVKLLRFLDMNATGIRKILKKFDKRFGYNLGSARAVNRRYISDCVPLKTRLQASAGFVSASALGMACGPALAGQPLLLDAKERHDEDGEDNDDNEEDPEESHKPATSLAAAYRLLTPSVKVQLLIYFMLKFAMEILLSESSVVTTYYFNWTTSTVAIFLAVLGLTVLPVNVIVGTYVTNLFQDRQILVASEIMVLIGIVMSFCFTPQYSVPQYVTSALITFVFAEVLEGVNLSLLSHVMSSRLSRGTYNGGLLSTEAGTLARVAADMMITAAGYLGQSRLLNATLVPSLVICVGSIVATFCTYNSLY
nr:unnamed protein product [Digitaria exilis]